MNFFTSSIIGVLISVILIYALLSIVVSILAEWWNHLRSSRGIMLKQSIMSMLDDKLNLEFGKLFYNHPLICGIGYVKTKHLPQYISSSMFADVLIDVISHQAISEVKVRKKSKDGLSVYETVEDPEDSSSAITDTDPLSRFKMVLEKKMVESPFRDLLISFYSKAKGNYTKLKTMLEQWFDEHMERVSNLYKAKLRNKLLFFGFVVAIALNVDSIHLFRMLSYNKELTNRLVTVAEGVADNYVTLLDSQKTEVVQQISILKTTLEEKKDSLILQSTTRTFDTTQLNSIYQRIDNLVLKMDSSQQQFYDNTKLVLSFINELGIPIGWSNKSAPISWFLKKQKKQEFQKGMKLPVFELSDYMKRRDFTPTPWDVLLYILGICITGAALSFGAPFWFDALVKLVNIRRAGNKPPVSAATKK